MIIEKIIGTISETEVNGRIEDKVLMDHYDLTKPHQKVKSDAGNVYAISLEQGQTLTPGAVIYEDNERIAYIELIPEDCLVIRPSGNIEWGRAAFNIGNMHQAAYIKEDCILVAYDAIMEGIIKKLGVDYERCQRRLEGIRANVSQGEGHSHSHGHTHSHTHDHK